MTEGGISNVPVAYMAQQPAHTSFFCFFDAFPGGFMSSTPLRFDGGCEWLGIICTSTTARDMHRGCKAARLAPGLSLS